MPCAFSGIKEQFIDMEFASVCFVFVGSALLQEMKVVAHNPTAGTTPACEAARLKTSGYELSFVLACLTTKGHGTWFARWPTRSGSKRSA